MPREMVTTSGKDRNVWTSPVSYPLQGRILDPPGIPTSPFFPKVVSPTHVQSPV